LTKYCTKWATRMGLTRPRAYQIFDIDYKQSVRVITLSNVTLAGGAPSTVDGVSLTINDRVLVAGQDNTVQNGLYYVTTVGSGSNGTWQRSIDGDQSGEIDSGMIVMVTEGLTQADISWKLVTDDPIIIGVTELVFEQNTGDSFGNVNANGTAILADTVSSVLNIAAGNNISISGNNTSKTVTIDVTGISLNSISNGTSNVNVISSGGNVTVGVGGTSNVAEFSTSGLRVTGLASVTGNIIGGNLSGTSIAGTLTTAAQPNITSVGTLSSVSVTGNVQGGNVRTVGLISATGNITGGNVSATNLTGSLTTAAQANITSVGTLTSLAVTGNISSGNVSGTRGAFTNIAGTLETAAQPNITSVGTLSSVSVTGNVQGGNVRTVGLISATGNITGNFILGNGSQLTGIDATSIQNGTANVRTFLNGNVTTSAAGTANVLVVTSTGTVTTGTTSATGNITGGNILTAGLVSATGNVTGSFINGNGSGLTGINAFSNITVTGGNSAVADSIADTLTLTAGSGIAIVVDSDTDTITIAAAGSSEIFVDGADFGTVTEPVTESDDLGLVTDAVTAENDLGTLVVSGLIYPDQFVLPSYTTSTLPAASPAGAMIYVTNESGGAVPAFADGTNWRRVTDRAIVT
jgi:hypothetical protein